MKDFGYTVIKQRTIDYDQFDGRLLNEVLKMEPSFKVCLSCGGCTATCSANDLVSFNVRRMNLMLAGAKRLNLNRKLKNVCSAANACWFAHAESTSAM